jgi:hypothetical protein
MPRSVKYKFRLTLDRTDHNTLDEILLDEGVHTHDGGDNDHNGAITNSCCHQLSLALTCILSGNGGDHLLQQVLNRMQFLTADVDTGGIL